MNGSEKIINSHKTFLDKETANQNTIDPESNAESNLESPNEKREEISEVADPVKMEEYTSRNIEISDEIKKVEEKIGEDQSKIDSLASELGITNRESEEAPSITRQKEKLQKLELEKIASSANYPGDWTNLLMERMTDPLAKEKFIKTRTEAMDKMKDGEPGFLDKPEEFSSHYQAQIDNYEERIKHVFDATEIGTASDHDKKPENAGMGNIDKQGVVFDDSINKDKPLNNRQKNIIEAHEKGHGLRDFKSETDRNDFKSCLDFDVLNKIAENRNQNNDERFPINYMATAEEIAERMSQLKNYFGMKASDSFTKEHLQYAKDHFIEDTGLDNNMTEFFKSITTQTEEKFIKTINKYPI